VGVEKRDCVVIRLWPVGETFVNFYLIWPTEEMSVTKIRI